MQDWHFWLVAALLLAVSEMFSGDFWLTCIAIGCLAATLVGLSPLGLTAQVIGFAAVTLVSMGFVRPALLRRFRLGPEIRTNVDALLGRTGVVTERIGPGSAGRAKVDGEDWRCAVMDDDAVLEPGTRVTVVQVDGSTLLVEREN